MSTTVTAIGLTVILSSETQIRVACFAQGAERHGVVE
jgi:hypothetical protein